MPKGIVSIYVKCPYYKREEHKQQKKIVCEGCVEDTSLHMMFQKYPDLKAHKDQFCNRDYRKCPIAQMLDRKYEYEP